MNDQIFPELSNDEYLALARVFKLFIQLEDSIHKTHDELPFISRNPSEIKRLINSLAGPKSNTEHWSAVFKMLNILKEAYGHRYSKSDREAIFESFYGICVKHFPEDSWERLEVSCRRACNRIAHDLDAGSLRIAKLRCKKMMQAYCDRLEKETYVELSKELTDSAHTIKCIVHGLRMEILTETITMLRIFERSIHIKESGKDLYALPLEILEAQLDEREVTRATIYLIILEELF